MEFKNPLFFLLLLVLVPYIVWYVMRFKQSLPSLKVPDTTKYVKVPKTFRLYLMHLPFLLRIILISLVVCILARPQSRHSWSNTDVEGIDIMLAVDVSTSMLAQDFKPNRVEALKEIAQRFIEKRPNDNIGLTMFAGEAYTTGITKSTTLLLVLGAVSMLGKMAGGWLAKGLGIWKSLLLMVVGAIICFIGRNLHIAVMLTGIFLVNCTMPITLYWANTLIRGKEGLAFGLLAASLIPGYLLATLDLSAIRLWMDN